MVHIADISDEALLARVASGDQRALEALSRRHSTALLRFIARKLRAHHDPADVLQETMLEVWRGAGRFKGGSSVRTWMFGIARNRAVDRMRRFDPEPMDAVRDDRPDEGPGPEAAVIARSDAAWLRDCLKALSEPHRVVIELAFFQDLDYRDIARLQRVPLGTVKTRVLHAKQQLRHRIAARRLCA